MQFQTGIRYGYFIPPLTIVETCFHPYTLSNKVEKWSTAVRLPLSYSRLAYPSQYGKLILQLNSHKNLFLLHLHLTCYLFTTFGWLVENAYGIKSDFVPFVA